jgi:hypothetical protein
VKVEASVVRWEQGARYVATYLVTFPSLIIPLLAPLLRRNDSQFLVRQSIWIFLIATYAYILGVGGDFMNMGRFLVPLLPFSALVFGLLTHALLADQRLPATIRAAVLLIPLLSLPPAFGSGKGIVPFAAIQSLHFRWSLPQAITELEIWRTAKEETAIRSAKGRALARIAKRGDSVVLAAIGATGYYSRLNVYDRNGLVTPEVLADEREKTSRSPGHWKTVLPSFFLKHRPTFIDPYITMPEGGESIPRIARPHGYLWKRIPVLPEDGFSPGATLGFLCRVEGDSSHTGATE